ncbi:MAG: metal-dependent transcriptional regulator [Candidatus Abyssobacteria bacterium SURF_5]|uniref:Transcriptional regulator MntR n=1 Tax=Abyssobacteria bacterium (strain SURF_5) TaxID=2093360 RepID=A0A3A4NQC7_ABYX5|nr:MAG: metal-dependent transcriptional regulator [Candidatus Abyssubacteria bacterium SURF_5]
MVAPLSPSQEDYLETIYQIGLKKRAVRSKDIARSMKVTRPSVTGALQSLAEKGLIQYEPYEFITLTPKGLIAARRVVRRHTVMHDFLTKVLGICRAEAEEQACRLEHAISGDLTRRLALFVEFLESCPEGIEAWAERFNCFRVGRRAECVCEASTLHAAAPKSADSKSK